VAVQSQRVDFKSLKREARSKIALLQSAEPTLRVLKGLAALNLSLKLLDGCTGMGFQIQLRPAGARTARRGVVKRARRK
jgi:hypothetical protein